MAIQREDMYLHDLGKKILGGSADYRTKWRGQATIGMGVKDSRNVGPSSNWAQLAFGNCAWDRFTPGIDGLKLVLSEPNDFLQGETRVDGSHALFSYIGICTQRRFLRAWDRATSDLCDAVALQWVAQMVIDSVGIHAVIAAKSGTTAYFDAVKRMRFAWAHQRTVAPSGGTNTKWDYVWRRGNGVSHRSTGLAQLGEKSATNQAPFTSKLFCDYFADDLRADMARVRGAFLQGGYAGLTQLIQRGSRGVFHDIRFKSGGYASVQETDIGTDERRDVVISPNVGPELIQFPSGLLPRLATRQGSSAVDMERGLITSNDSVYGNFRYEFNPEDVQVWFVQNPAGCELRRGSVAKEDAPVDLFLEAPVPPTEEVE